MLIAVAAYMATIKLTDEVSHTVLESKPAKIDIHPNSLMLSSWKIPTPERAGVYRADVMVDGVIYWRVLARLCADH